MEEFKLRVVYIPANPPSPVPEESEEGSPSSASAPQNGKQRSSSFDAVSIFFFFFILLFWILSFQDYFSLTQIKKKVIIIIGSLDGSAFLSLCLTSYALQVSRSLEVPKQKSSEVKISYLYLCSPLEISSLFVFFFFSVSFFLR